MAEERKGAVTMRGNPMTLIGPELKPGQKAPNFSLVGKDMKPVTLEQLKGKVKILAVSMDLPFAAARWCGAAGVDKVMTASDYRGAHFGEAYGALIKELYLDARAVFVIDKNDNLVHVEYVKEVANQPNFEAALDAARKAASA
jgi:thiol peroxidase